MWLNPKNDVVFSTIFGRNDEESKELLLAFMKDLTNNTLLNHEEVQIESPMLSPKLIEEKGSVLDIRAKFKNGPIFNLEMLENLTFAMLFGKNLSCTYAA